jgi:hypothetical protein
MHVNQIDAPRLQNALNGFSMFLARLFSRCFIERSCTRNARNQLALRDRAFAREHNGFVSRSNQCGIQAREHLFCATDGVRANRRKRIRHVEHIQTHD